MPTLFLSAPRFEPGSAFHPVQQRIDDSLRRLYSGAAPPLLFHQDPTGFGSQVARRILALRLALVLDRPVVFVDETMHPYANPFERLDAFWSPRAIEPGEAQHLDRLNFWDYWADASMQNRVNTLFADRHPGPQEVLQRFIDGCLMSYMTLQPRFAEAALQAVQALNLPPRYLAVHYRRGDKGVETPLLRPRQYRDAVIAAAERGRLQDVFLASDSPSALAELAQEGTGLRWHFDHQERRLNNANHRYLAAHPEQAERETITCLKNMIALAGGASVVGQDNAHFATLAAAHRIYRSHDPHRVLLLDARSRLKESPWVRQVHAAKLQLRTWAKRLLPGRTMAGRKAPASRA